MPSSGSGSGRLSGPGSGSGRLSGHGFLVVVVVLAANLKWSWSWYQSWTTCPCCGVAKIYHKCSSTSKSRRSSTHVQQQQNIVAAVAVAVVVIKQRIYTNNERHHMADPSTMLASGPAGDISLREAPAQGDGGTLAPPLQQAEPYCRG